MKESAIAVIGGDNSCPPHTQILKRFTVSSGRSDLVSECRQF